jgi:hypothetical protein
MRVRIAAASCLPLVLLLLLPSCEKKKASAGTPTRTGAVVGTFDALGAVPSYSPRIAARLGVATADPHETRLTVGGGLVLTLHWDTRDDVAFARRYLTAARVEVAVNASCSVYAARLKPARAQSPTDSVRLELELDYVCAKGDTTEDLSGRVAMLSTEWPSSFGTTASVQPSPEPAPERPRVMSVHFAASSANLDAAATRALDGFLRVTDADPALNLCTAYLDIKAIASTQDKRLAAVRKYLVDHGLAAARAQSWTSTQQAPPLTDDIELWPREPACADPRKSR